MSRSPRTRNVGLIRVLRMLRFLRRPRTIDQLTVLLGVTRRTIYRDLNLLRAAGARIRATQETTHSPAQYFLVWMDDVR